MKKEKVWHESLTKKNALTAEPANRSVRWSAFPKSAKNASSKPKTASTAARANPSARSVASLKPRIFQTLKKTVAAIRDRGVGLLVLPHKFFVLEALNIFFEVVTRPVNQSDLLTDERKCKDQECN
jgi:hypothetical protein